ncbi:hypothetical protein AURDEDRAFT_117902 [Auricularia subglabra TFB-10046 SS5]|uniref:Uncharacterized protein n=1 Tax=Auricularia subglabra (strain TFB-10046 / SS5) TaxID=717982 RepID=J0D3S6_AURST|nr:hypothetical protein AURDEDRAFT_117902 [Auricularia subglabra TFB-10046 SS5]
MLVNGRPILLRSMRARQRLTRTDEAIRTIPHTRQTVRSRSLLVRAVHARQCLTRTDEAIRTIPHMRQMVCSSHSTHTHKAAFNSHE